jgi:hypothetical protein
MNVRSSSLSCIFFPVSLSHHQQVDQDVVLRDLLVSKEKYLHMSSKGSVARYSRRWWSSSGRLERGRQASAVCGVAMRGIHPICIQSSVLYIKPTEIYHPSRRRLAKPGRMWLL